MVSEAVLRNQDIQLKEIKKLKSTLYIVHLFSYLDNVVIALIKINKSLKLRKT